MPHATPARWAVALVIALASDAVSVAASFAPALQVGVDLATALLLWAVLGWSWMLLVALVPEALPVVAVFPTWTLVVVAMKGVGLLRKGSDRSATPPR